MAANQQKKLYLTILALATALAGTGAQTGCGSNHNASSVKPQSYANDGYLGQQDANPHIPGRHMALSYKNDAVLLREAIKNVHGVRGSAVTFNGADAYVRIKVDPRLNAREALRVEREAASVLRFNFPRYTVHVTSSK